jgi:hypothetical protein
MKSVGMNKLCPGSARRWSNDHVAVSQPAHTRATPEFAGLGGSMRYREGMHWGWVVVVALAGCGDSGASLEYMDDDFPAGGCRGTDGSSTNAECETEAEPTSSSGAVTTTTTGAAMCESTDDCIGTYCVAPWDAAVEARGEFTCEFACVGLLDERRWCMDDAACCVDGSRCTARGYCIFEDDASSSSSEGTSSSSGDASSGATSSGSTGE